MLAQGRVLHVHRNRPADLAHAGGEVVVPEVGQLLQQRASGRLEAHVPRLEELDALFLHVAEIERLDASLGCRVVDRLG